MAAKMSAGAAKMALTSARVTASGRWTASLSIWRALANRPCRPRSFAPTPCLSWRKHAKFLSIQASNNSSSRTSKAGNLTVPLEGAVKETWAVKMLFDGDCPLCMREVNMLRERNQMYGSIKFVDISDVDYSPEENCGVDFVTAMGRIHAVLPDGTILYDVMKLIGLVSCLKSNDVSLLSQKCTQPQRLPDIGYIEVHFDSRGRLSICVQAFKKLYEEVGLGWVYAFTKIKPLAKIGDAIYSIWAKYRLPITGRPPLIQILEARQKAKESCGSTKCRVG